MISANLNSIQYQLPFHPNLLESVIQSSPSFPICHFQVKQFQSNIYYKATITTEKELTPLLTQV